MLTISTADWINIVIASVAFIAAIIALFTVNEIKKQRLHSYHPDINMADFSFYVYQGDYDEEIKTNFLYTYRERKNEGDSIGGFNQLTMDINNIGFGVAKNIKWKWDFDFDKAEKVICENQEVWWRMKDNILSVDSKELNVEWTYDIEEDNEERSFNFILPYSNENRKTEIVVPSYFVDLYWLYMAGQLLVEKPKAIYINFPSIELSVFYTDIQSNKISKIFNIDLKFDMISGPGNKSKELGKFRFEITEKNK
ncbi:hypothetical protein [Lutibacter sp. B1]|uniref:hypothetical protein n=1 Tax=Lutibacter sp. B1 TaxID=2725996 RepID=UPI001456BAD2|nr:hypothetical protein [Lutibacter sp. B1]NLP59322.1 hypothetical protein [Lutibacter sp. B1]NLP59323.1 hypothetical protein [Lutibacter sp. B1]